MNSPAARGPFLFCGEARTPLIGREFHRSGEGGATRWNPRFDGLTREANAFRAKCSQSSAYFEVARDLGRTKTVLRCPDKDTADRVMGVLRSHGIIVKGKSADRKGKINAEAEEGREVTSGRTSRLDSMS